MESLLFSSPDVIKVTHEQIVLVVVVHVEGRPADPSAIEDVLDGDCVERLLHWGRWLRLVRL